MYANLAFCCPSLEKYEFVLFFSSSALPFLLTSVSVTSFRITFFCSLLAMRLASSVLFGAYLQ